MTRLSVGQQVTLACMLEATAPKPGNVHRGADFEDATFTDFLAAAVAIGPVFETSGRSGVGELVREAVEATQALVDHNVNLGMVLLLGIMWAMRK